MNSPGEVSLATASLDAVSPFVAEDLRRVWRAAPPGLVPRSAQASGAQRPCRPLLRTARPLVQPLRGTSWSPSRLLKSNRFAPKHSPAYHAFLCLIGLSVIRTDL